MYPVLELIRLEEDPKHGTFGVLKINKFIFCVTLEPPDRENKRHLSSIPAQQYFCERITWTKWGPTYEVLEVPDRSEILFHPGNHTRDTPGCILLAEKFGKLRGERTILNSGSTFNTFMGRLEGHEVLHLTISEVY